MMNHLQSCTHASNSSIRTISMMLVFGVFLLACGVSTPSQPPNEPAPQNVDSQPTAIIPVAISTDTPIPPTSPETVATEAPVLTQPTATSGCPSSFSCSDSGLPPLVLAAGGPNDPAFNPCEFPRSEAWVDSPAPYVMEMGERRYFFACDFPSTPASASVVLSDGSIQGIPVLGSIPNPDLRTGNAMAVVGWPALPNQPVGIYTITISTADGIQAQLQFQVNPPSVEHILTVPDAGLPGTIFDVYYVNFEINTSPTFTFYGEEQMGIGGDHTLSYLGTWQVAINQPLQSSPGKGWGQQSLISAVTDRVAAYSITYDNWRIFNLFWLR